MLKYYFRIFLAFRKKLEKKIGYCFISVATNTKIYFSTPRVHKFVKSPLFA